MIGDDCELARLVWHPSHFDPSGELKTSAFPSGDLLPATDSSRNSYLSVDALREMSQSSVDWTVSHQQRGDLYERERRHKPKFAVLIAGTLRAVRCEWHQSQIFEVRRARVLAGELGPDAPANEAHCAISVCALPDDAGLIPGKKVYKEMLRTQLKKAVVAVLEYNDVFSSIDVAGQRAR